MPFLSYAPILFISALSGEDEKNREAKRDPVKPKLAGVWINTVKNAPGDGNQSLKRAIKAVIKGAGLIVARDKRYAEFVLDTVVNVGPPDNDNLQRVEIVWTVSTTDDREIGKATQKNLVRAGTFAAAWGEVAVIVAEAALKGIQGILRAAGTSPARLGPPERVLNTEIPLSKKKLTLPPPSLELEGLQRLKKTP